MSDVNQAVGKTLEIFNNTVEKAIELVATTAPEIMQEVLLWNGLRSFGCFAVTALLVIVLYKVDMEYYKQRKNLSEDKVLFLISLNIVTLMPIIIFGAFGFNWVKILIAPKLYLFEYFTQFVK